MVGEGGCMEGKKGSDGSIPVSTSFPLGAGSPLGSYGGPTCSLAQRSNEQVRFIERATKYKPLT